MEYLKTHNRAELNRLTVPQLDEFITRLKVPRQAQVQRNMEAKTDKINSLLRFYRKQFDGGHLFIEVKERTGKKKK